MSDRSTLNTPRRYLAGWAGLLLTLQTATAFAPPVEPPTRGSAPNMADARVNLKAAWQNATARRPGALDRGLAATRDAVAASMAQAAALRDNALPGLRVGLSPLTGGVSEVGSTRGALTQTAPGVASETIVRDFLADNATLYGLSPADLDDLVVLGDSAGGRSGLRMLRVEQRIDGRPVFQSETRFLLDRDGRLHKSVGLLVPHARPHVVPFDANTLIAPEEAVVQLMASVGTFVNAATLTRQPEADGKIELEETDDVLAGTVTTRQVLFPLAPGMLVPAWSVVAMTTQSQDWYAVVDAQTGDVLWRKNIRNNVSNHDARFRVYVQGDGVTPADSPSPASPTTAAPGNGTQFPGIAPSIVSMHAAMDPLASPNGWIDDCQGGVCSPGQSQTLGNNALVCLDRVGGNDANTCDSQADSVLDGNGRPMGNPDPGGLNRDFLGLAPRNFETGFVPPPTGIDAEAGQSASGTGAAQDQFRRGAITHLFYLTNWYHDQLFAFGFDEASANFQQTNFSGSGAGNDRVLGDAQDGESTDNANFATPPDGISGRMQMFRFAGPTVDRDGGLDAEIVFHELTHGTTNRLVGNAAGLNWDPAAALGEGWGDFYALSLLNNAVSDDPDGQYASGGYATFKLAMAYADNYVYGIRRFPYSTDNTVNPLTWGDVDDVTNNINDGIAPDPLGFNFNGGMEVHNAGELWALSLWEVRSRIVASAGGNVPAGNATMLQLVTDALKLTPIDPSFTDARDALIEADCITNACFNETAIWEGFADRGLGYGGGSPYNVGVGLVASHLGIRESFLVPHLDIADGFDGPTIDDTSGNHNQEIDPGEAVHLEVSLFNPFRNTARLATGTTVTLTTVTPGVTVHDNQVAFADVPAQATVPGEDGFLLTVDPGVPCGSAIDLTFTIESSLGSSVVTRQIRVGNANGTNPPVTFSGTPLLGLAIPDDAPRGVFHEITVPDDLVIADIDFRIDSLTHAFVGDITAMLRSPDGVGTDFVSLISFANDFGGADIANMRIDDDLPFDASVDMVQTSNLDAPYTGAWLPVFNAPWANLTGFLTPDPIGSLSRFDGKSTRGTWTVLMSDQFAADVGTLNGWSMVVTPVRFECTVAVPAAQVSATKMVQGDFVPGGAVTYTIVLTNDGTALQGNNPGDELVDVLPDGVTLVQASASAGAVKTDPTTDTVTWNGALIPLGGSVTLLIGATIDADIAPGIVANQAQVNFDGNNDGTNDTATSSDDPTVGGTLDPTVFTIAPVGPDLQISKSNGASQLVAGDKTMYTIIASNVGSMPVINATLADTLPVQLTQATWTCSAIGTTCPAPAGAGNIAVQVSLPVGASITLEVTATVQGAIGSVVGNSATVLPPLGTNDSSPGNNTATDSDPIVPAPIFKDSFED